MELVKMKIHSRLIKLIFLLSIAVSPFSVAENFMTEEEMLNTFSGITLSGVSIYDGNSRWTQAYGEIKEGITKGVIRGDFSGKPYDSQWFIKEGKWCENWGSGNGCYDLVLIDEKTIRAYDKGVPLVNLWEIQ